MSKKSLTNMTTEERTAYFESVKKLFGKEPDRNVPKKEDNEKVHGCVDSISAS